MALAFGPMSCSSVLVLKSKLLHSPEAQYGFVPKHSLHGGKNNALRAEKPIIATKNPDLFRVHELFFSEAAVFASEDVLRCGAMCDDVVAGAGACSQAQVHDSSTEARRAKTSKRGF